MIKLKTLLKEAQNPTQVWKTPSGTPDEVINLYHVIVSYLLKQKLNADDYLTIEKDNVEAGTWILRHRRNPNVFLLYDPSLIDDGSGPGKAEISHRDWSSFVKDMGMEVNFKFLLDPTHFWFDDGSGNGAWVLDKDELQDVIQKWSTLK
jgi:hypothetical protein